MILLKTFQNKVYLIDNPCVFLGLVIFASITDITFTRAPFATLSRENYIENFEERMSENQMCRLR